ncbi:MAG: diguanylate cyclase [Methyloprofundus sp.]|nr:diguanylate cyclase [Methyloprofundus sp.]
MRRKVYICRKKLLIVSIIVASMFGGTHASVNKKFMSTPNPTIELTDEERVFLDELGVLQVLVDDDFLPISYYDESENKFSGIAIDVLQMLAEMLQFEYEIIRDESLNWAARLDKVKRNEIHILGGASRNAERKEYGVFTTHEYFTVNYAMIKSIDNHLYINNMEKISHYKVGLSEGSTINNYMRQFLSDPTQVLNFPSDEIAFQALKRHEIDLYPYNETAFKEEFFGGDLFDFEVAFSMRDTTKRYAFFSPKTDDGKRLVQLLDKGMQHLDIKNIIADRYHNKSNFSVYKDHLENVARLSYYKTIGLSLLLIFLLVVGGAIVLLRREALKKEELIHELHEVHKQLTQQASHDFLTGLPNRALFKDRLLQVSILSKRMERPFAILFMDLDGFKHVNDRYGHDIGDLLLIEVAKRLQSCVRKSDTIARMGGDEFAAILPELHGQNYPDIIAQRILDALSHPIEIDEHICNIGICIGISLFPEHSSNHDELISMADHAMYTVKRQGKNNYRYWQEDLVSE